MPFYKAGDGFVTAPKIPVKTSLRYLTKSFLAKFLLQWCAKHT